MVRFYDRFWWVDRFGGGLLAIGCLIGAIQSVILGLELSQLPSDNSAVSQLWHLETQKAFLQAGKFLLFVGIGVFSIWDSFPVHRRVLRRQRALDGEQEAMRRARIQVDRRHAPNLSEGSLELLWRAKVSTSRVMTALFVTIFVIFAFLAGVFVYLAYLIITSNPSKLSLLEQGALAAVTVGLAALFLAVVVILARYLPAYRGKPFGIIAETDGLWYYPRAGKRRFLRWEEIRLLEVILPQRERYRKYTLYGGKAIAQWWEQPPSSLSLFELGLTKREFEERHQALLDLIAARTGLLPRTSDKRLFAAAGEIEGAGVQQSSV